MKWVKWSHWTDAGMAEFGQGPLNKVVESIQQFGQEAKKVLKETGADHVVYAIKYLDDNGELDEVCFYMHPMTEEEFEKEVANKPGVQVCALHAMR